MLKPLVFCWSGGKDSALALHELRAGGEFEIVSLLTTINRDFDRVSMHGVRRELLEAQAAALGLPVDCVQVGHSASNAEYESQMESRLCEYRARGVRHVAFGDIFLEDLRTYRERQLARAGMEAVFPLWKRDTMLLARELIDRGFRSTTCCIDASRLDDAFVGREFDREFLDGLPREIDPCGENGEFHSFTWAGPIFDRELSIRTGELVRRDSFLFADLLPN